MPTELVTAQNLVIAVVATGVMLLCILIFRARLGSLMTCGQLPCERFGGYTSNFLYGEFNQYGPQGRADYRVFLIADIIFALVYGLALAIWVTYVFNRLFGVTPLSPWVATVPLLAGTFDICEDCLLWVALSRYPTHFNNVVLASWATRAKFVAVVPSFLFVVLGLMWKGIVS